MNRQIVGYSFFERVPLLLRQHANDPGFIILLAVLIGGLVGTISVALRMAVHGMSELLLFALGGQQPPLLYALLPLVGILLTVFFATYVFKSHPGHGVTKVLYAIVRQSGILRGVYMYSSVLASALTVGFGGSVGLEAPVVIAGASIASNVSVLGGMTYKNRMLLMASGAASGISAIFNAPVAGTIFAVEVLMADSTSMRLIPILIASAVGAVVAKVLLPEEHLFSFTLMDDFRNSDIPYYLLLGVFCGMVSVYFVRTIYWTEQRMSLVRSPLNRVLVGGGIVVIMLFLFPALRGEGYHFIARLLHEDHVLPFSPLLSLTHAPLLVGVMLLLLLISIKPFATSLTIDAGGGGGVFAPSLFVGASVGYLYAVVVSSFSVNISTSNMVLMGMCGR